MSTHARRCCCLFLVATLSPNLARATLPVGNPFNETIPKTFWSVALEDVITIPNSKNGRRPRLEFLAHGGTAGRAYVIDQRGEIYSFNPTASNPTTSIFLDLSTAVPNFKDGGQEGVRGLAFHPDFSNQDTDGYRKFYTSHTRTIGASERGDPYNFGPSNFQSNLSVVGEWTVNANGTVNTGSYRELIRVRQPIGDHNIGQIGFNPNASPGQDDYGNLYIAMGDGGSNAFPQTATDVHEHGQGLDELFGALLRINPIASGGEPYTIPSDNAFKVSNDPSNPQNLIYSSGLRNPHRFTFDTAGDGKLLISDIGQGNVEEVNLGFNGANFGWGLREGTFVDTKLPFIDRLNQLDSLPTDHPTDVFTYPVAQYDHRNNILDSSNSSAIAGGEVYRGTAIPELTGMFLFGDFAKNSGPIFAVDVDELVQREDFSNLSNLDGGKLAPFEEVRLTHNGTEKSMLQIIRDTLNNQSLTRNDLRMNIGPDGELYILNKHDGRVRRLVSVSGLSAGDADRDGDVDGADFLQMQRGFGPNGDWSDGDYNGTKTVDSADYVLWRENYGSQPGELEASSQIPEPATIAVGLISLLLLLQYRARRLGWS